MSRDWSAVMIGSDEDFAGAPLLRKEFVLDEGDVRQATMYATARGVFTASINGVNVS
ncbi:MAG: alpha-L-rhamnosidase, partial [Pseudonocardiales bacterium]|nr:alpha-L-rhamnosidase [Pseudonocardiales bacterium]